MNEEDIEN